jgi:hypothetical protein
LGNQHLIRSKNKIADFLQTIKQKFRGLTGSEPSVFYYLLEKEMDLENKILSYSQYIKHGLHLTKLHGMISPDVCSCFAGPNCMHKGKHPIKDNWKADLITDQTQLLNHFKEYPYSNLGVCCSVIDNIIILDFDLKNKGLESLSKLESLIGKLPVTPTSKTGGGGFHYIYKCNPEIKKILKFNPKEFPGLDILKNHNAVAAGSKHFSGKSYEFIDGLSLNDVHIADLPESLIKLFTKAKPKNLKQNNVSIPEGQRNSELYKKAASMFSTGISEELISNAIHEINKASCNPYLDDEEVESIISSAKNCRLIIGSQYHFDEGNTLFCPNGDLENSHVISNFQAVIDHQKKIIDGSEDAPEVVLRVKIIHPKIEPEFYDVLPEEFEDCSFVGRIDGALVLYNPNKNKEHLRLAMRQLGNIDDRRLTHVLTGWVSHEGKNFFLTNSGAIGKDGLDNTYRTHWEIGGPRDYSLTPTKNIDDLRDAYLQTLKTLDVASRNITIPLFASAFRAVLVHFLPVDFCIGLIGVTGSMKSTLAGLFLSFFGPKFNYNHLPGSFRSTLNGLEKQTFLAKDGLFVIDDWVQGETTIYFAEQIIRGHGNIAGRVRMSKDAKTIKAPYYPRCLTILTAEDLQVGQSSRARLVIINSDKDSINFDLLTELQKIGKNGDFSKFLGSFVQWIAETWDQISHDIHIVFEKYRDHFNASTKHSRTAPNLAHLMVGIIFYARFCISKNLMAMDESEKFIEHSLDILTGLIEVQNDHQNISDPVELFLMCLQGAIENKRAHIVLPKNADRIFGKYMGYSDGSSVHPGFPDGEPIGHFDNGQLIIKPDICLGIVKRYAEDKRLRLHLSTEAMGKHFKAKGLLVTDSNRTTAKRSINGRRDRVWVFDNWLAILNPDFEQAAPTAPIAPLKNLIHVVKDNEELTKKTSDGTTSNKDLH